MARFLIKGSYTVEGVKGVVKEGAAGRKAAVEKALAGLGGRLDAIYFALGEADVYVVCEMPDLVSALAVSMAVNAAGGLRVTTVPLVSVEEMDAAVKKTVTYRAPGA